MRRDGLPVESVAPTGGIYVSVRVALNGARTPDGETLDTNESIRSTCWRAAGVAVVPFQAFGMPDESGWSGLSVGAVSPAEVAAALPRLREAVGAVAAGM
jgi:aspartate aminotransferase